MRKFTAGTIKHTNSFNDNFRKEFNLSFLNEDLELEEAKRRAAKHSAVKEDLRKRDLHIVAKELETENTEISSWKDVVSFNAHLNAFEQNFEDTYASMVKGTRNGIQLYASSIASTLIALNLNSPIAFKLLKRLAIRLGLTQYTAHF